jgi:von Willebrand factor type A domain/von Willebrand factor type A C-terminal domain
VTEPTRPEYAFDLHASQNKYLPVGDREMHAIVVVSAGDLGPPPDAAEVILVDCSASMGQQEPGQPEAKIAAARRAAIAAVDQLRDGTGFAIVRGALEASQVYPIESRLAVASASTKEEARAEIAHLTASGGTAIGRWLMHAKALLDAQPAAIRHAILLTDGKNEHETRAELERILAACAGRFNCDARGIGDHWEPAELRRIVSVLRGKADAAKADELAGDFRAMMAESMGKVVPDLRLAVRAMPGVGVRFVKQVFPTELDLTEHGQPLDERTVEFPTGSWGSEAREYHVCLDVDSTGRPLGDDLQVGLVGMQAVAPDGSRAVAHKAQAGIFVHWTDDPVRVTRVDPKVSHYLGQDDLRAAANAGCDAYDAGDLDGAREQWGRAARLAHESGNEKVLSRLAGVVEIVDPAAGVVRIRDGIRRGDLSLLIAGSWYTQRGPDGDVVVAGSADPDQRCPVCDWVSPASARICTNCGRPLKEPA